MSGNFSDVTVLKEGLAGWGLGYTFVESKQKEDEIKQGKSYFCHFPFK
ncbi:MAG: hypothetical protein H0W50_08115 [Parachlamydiaceae bacterium]|nr:hypothetical protein [Parachlamydiaceae bacterium]